MSEGMQRVASIQLRDALQRVTQNKFSSFLTGFLTTAAIQSSSAATVMIVSFVNAGIISLMAAAGIIIGANLGTSVTIWIVTIFGFELNLFTLCLPLIAVAMPFLFLQNGKYRHWAEAVIGFSLLLISIEFLKSVVPDLEKHEEIMAFLGQLGDHGLLSIIAFIVIGIVFTALIQSSSAAITLTLTMCLNGLLPFDIAAAMVLGENIGTTLTTEIASWVGNTESKKAARVHVLFNLIGVLWMLPVLPVILPFISWMMQAWFGAGDPFTEAASMPAGLAIFYTFFNIINGILFLILMPELVALASRTVKTSDSDDQRKLFFIDTGSNMADLSLPIARQEILQQCQKVNHLNTILNRITNFTTEVEFHQQIKLAHEYLGTLAENQNAINGYLTGLVEDRSSLLTSKQIKTLLHIHLLIDSIRSKYGKIYQLIDDKRQKRIWFGPTQRSILLHRINDANVLLRRCIELIQSKNINKSNWKSFQFDIAERSLDYIDYERELMRELERGEMKLSSVITYYRMAQYMDSINESLNNILNELAEEPTTQKAVSA